MNYLILFNSKVEKQVVLNNKYNKICTLRGSDPMPDIHPLDAENNIVSPSAMVRFDARYSR